MEVLQWQYLNLVGEQCDDKELYKKDLQSIYSVDLDKSARIEAEQRVKREVAKAGEMINHGDLLTEVRFEACKRLRRMCVSAVERFDFLRVFKPGTFHLRMNKTIQDINCMDYTQFKFCVLTNLHPVGSSCWKPKAWKDLNLHFQ